MFNAQVIKPTSIFAADVIIPSGKKDEPHALRVALCIISGDVVQSTCSCVARKTGYCNHSLALMLKMCKYSLFESTSTHDLHDDADNPTKTCTSRLQTWHRKGRGDKAAKIGKKLHFFQAIAPAMIWKIHRLLQT